MQLLHSERPCIFYVGSTMIKWNSKILEKMLGLKKWVVGQIPEKNIFSKISWRFSDGIKSPRNLRKKSNKFFSGILPVQKPIFFKAFWICISNLDYLQKNLYTVIKFWIQGPPALFKIIFKKSNKNCKKILINQIV